MKAFAVPTVLVLACAGRPLPETTTSSVSALEIAQLEARRGAGVEELIGFARSQESTTRALAVRGLGRVGGPRAIAELRRQLAGQTTAAAQAAQALGLAATFSELDLETSAALSAAASRRDLDRPLVLEAVGRGGDATGLPALTAALAEPDPTIVEVAAIALGRFGRRKIALDDAARAALVETLQAPSVPLRFAAAWALWREHRPVDAPADEAVIKGLRVALGDADPDLQRVAVAALAAREATAEVEEPRDWRVEVEVVRAGWHNGPALARWTTRGWAQAQRGLFHPVIELVRKGSVELDRVRPLLPAGAISLLGYEVVAESAKPVAARFDQWHALVQDASDDRGRAAAFTVLPRLVPELDPQRRRAAFAEIRAALANPSPAVAGAAAEALGEMLGEGASEEDRAAMADDLVAQLEARRGDVELEATLLTAASKAQLAAAEPSCRRAAVDPRPVVADAGRACLDELGQDPGPAVEHAAALPLVDPSRVIGKTVVWRVETNRGTLIIDLDPQAAPWHVAALVDLTSKGFYDGLLFHRVVADFVVQGGDPTGTGWGGPGYTLPSEPSAAKFEKGAVGIADAGKDSGGSQWFIMHSRAPHLEGRYTYVGKVMNGQEVADRLVVGDVIVRATVDVK